MSVLINGMEMPTSCPCELLGIGYDLSCSFAGGIPARVKEYYECCQNGTRPPWCPLGPVPPHGRLIDADEMRDEWLINGENEYLYDTNAFLESIDNQPTVIPAEFGGA